MFGRLVGGADAVFANFKPGTLAALGFSYEKLRALNPRIVLAESSAFGDTGPWSARLGYGPLVRASTGVTRLWTSEEADTGRRPACVLRRDDGLPRSCGRADHRDRRAGRADPPRRHTGAAPASTSRRPRRRSTSSTPCSSPAVPTAEHPRDTGGSRHRLRRACTPCARRGRMVRHLATRPMPTGGAATDGDGQRPGSWELVGLDARRTPDAGRRAPAGGRGAGRPDEPASGRARRPAAGRPRCCTGTMTHPLFDGSLPAESGPAPFRHIRPAPQRPAPLPGQDTREICRRHARIATGDRAADHRPRAVRADGVLHSPPQTRRSA